MERAHEDFFLSKRFENQFINKNEDAQINKFLIPLYTCNRIKQTSLHRFNKIRKHSPLISNIIYSELSNPMLSPNKNVLHKFNKNQNSICVLKDTSPGKKDPGGQLPFETINSRSLFEIIQTLSPIRIPKHVKLNHDYKSNKKQCNKNEEKEMDIKEQLFMKICDEEISEQNMLLKNSKDQINSNTSEKNLKQEKLNFRYVKIDRNSPVSHLNSIKEEFDNNKKALLGHLLFNNNNNKNKNSENEGKPIVKNAGRRNPIYDDYFKAINLTETDEIQNMINTRNKNYHLNHFSTEFDSHHDIEHKITIENNFDKNKFDDIKKNILNNKIELSNNVRKIPKRSVDYKVSILNLKSKLKNERSNQNFKNNLLQFKSKDTFNEDEFDMNQRIIQIVQSKRNKEVLTKKQLNKKITNLIFAKLVMNDFSIVNKVNEESKGKKKYNFDTILKYNKI